MTAEGFIYSGEPITKCNIRRIVEVNPKLNSICLYIRSRMASKDYTNREAQDKWNKGGFIREHV